MHRANVWLVWVVCAGMAAGLPAAADEAVKKQDADSATAATASAAPAEPKKKPFADDLYQKGNRLPNARLRFELDATSGFQSGRHSRDGDFGLRANIDYEIPIVEHLTISPRLIPVFWYDQKDESDVWAGGVGVVFRGYSNGKEQRGFYGEIGLHGIVQTDTFEGNSGYFNFIDELGAGYQFKKGWNVSAKVSHISNAGLAEHNASVNNFGLGLGYSFKVKR